MQLPSPARSALTYDIPFAVNDDHPTVEARLTAMIDPEPDMDQIGRGVTFVICGCQEEWFAKENGSR
jgi:hypothetical protein